MILGLNSPKCLSGPVAPFSVHVENGVVEEGSVISSEELTKEAEEKEHSVSIPPVFVMNVNITPTEYALQSMLRP